MPKWLTRPLEAEMKWSDDIFMLEGHTASIRAMVFSPDDKYLATCSFDGTVRLWDMTTMACSHCYVEAGLDPRNIAFALDSTKLAVGHVRDMNQPTQKLIGVNTYDTVTGSIARELHPIQVDDYERGFEIALTVNNNATVILAAMRFEELHVWRTTEDDPLVFKHVWTYRAELALQKLGYRVALAMCRAAPLLACLHIQGGSRRLSILNLATKSVVSIYDELKFAGGLAYHNMDLVVQKAEGRTSHFGTFDPYAGQFNCLISYHGGPWWTFAISNGREKIALCDPMYPKPVQICRVLAPPYSKVESSNQLQRVMQLEVSTNGGAIVVVRESYVEILDVRGETSFCHTLITDFNNLYHAVAVSSDGKLLALTFRKRLQGWDLQSPSEPVFTMRGEFSFRGGPGPYMCFSNDKKQLALPPENSLEVWDIEHDHQKMSLHTKTTITLSTFSDDGEKLFTSQGCVDVTNGTWVSEKGTYKDSSETGVSFDGGTFAMNTKWICFDNRELLWLPMKFRMRARITGCGGKTAVLGMNDGTLRIMEFIDPMTV